MFNKLKKAVTGSSTNMPSGKGHSLQGGSSHSSSSASSKSSRKSRPQSRAAEYTTDESHGLLARNQPPPSRATRRHHQSRDPRAAGAAAAQRLHNQKKKTTLQGCNTSDERKKRTVDILEQEAQGPQVTVFVCKKDGKKFYSFTSLIQHYEDRWPLERKPTPEEFGLPSSSSPASTPTNRSNGAAARRPSKKSDSPFVADASSHAGIQAQKRLDVKNKAKQRLADERQKKMTSMLFGDDNSSASSSSKSSKPKKSPSSAAAEVDLLTSTSSKASAPTSAEDVLFPPEPKSEDEVDGIPYHMRLEDTIHQYLNRNPSPDSLKIVKTVLGNVLKAETAQLQTKHGKVRLSNKKINATIVAVPHALDIMEAVGFKHVVIDDEPHLVFNFSKASNLQHTSIALGLITSAQSS